MTSRCHQQAMPHHLEQLNFLEHLLLPEQQRPWQPLAMPYANSGISLLVDCFLFTCIYLRRLSMIDCFLFCKMTPQNDPTAQSATTQLCNNVWHNAYCLAQCATKHHLRKCSGLICVCSRYGHVFFLDTIIWFHVVTIVSGKEMSRHFRTHAYCCSPFQIIAF